MVYHDYSCLCTRVFVFFCFIVFVLCFILKLLLRLPLCLLGLLGLWRTTQLPSQLSLLLGDSTDTKNGSKVGSLQGDLRYFKVSCFFNFWNLLNIKGLKKVIKQLIDLREGTTQSENTTDTRKKPANGVLCTRKQNQSHKNCLSQWL